MKRTGLLLSAITVAGMLIVTASTIAVASSDAHRFGGHGGFGGGPAFAGPQMAERLIRFLDLEDAQRDEVRGVVDAAQSELRALSDAIRDSRDALHELVEADTLDTGALRMAADRQGDLVADMIVLGAGVMNDVRAVLTPEQLEELESRFEDHHEGRRFGSRR